MNAIKRGLHFCKRQWAAWSIPVAAWMRRHGIPLRLSQTAQAFERYKAARGAMVRSDLSEFQVAAEEGLVSIVLPVYNGAAYLCEAIDSILAQSYARFELITLDDGSTDDTPKILSTYSQRDARIRVITQSNQKLPTALSNGFRKARGEFLTWTSADNRLRPEFLERMVACLQRHPSWDMIYANEDLIDEHGRPLRNSPYYPLYQRPLNSQHLYFPTETSELNVLFDNFVGGAFLYRARVRLLIGDYSSSLFGLEDYDYWMRINALLTLRHSDFGEPVYEYRFHSRSLTSQQADLQSAQNRERLLSMDAGRREFYLKPLAWRIEAGSSESARDLAAKLQQAVRAAGARAASAESPLVYVRIDAADMITSPPADVPATATKVLLVVGMVPRHVPPGWDLCVAWGTARPPRIAGDRQGWAATDNIEALLMALDVRARSDHCANPDSI